MLLLMAAQPHLSNGHVLCF